jgi:hypothetical protein
MEREELTVKSYNIVHVARRIIPILAVVKKEDISTHARKTAQCRKTSRATSNNDGIVVSLGDFGGRWLGDGCSVAEGEER